MFIKHKKNWKTKYNPFQKEFWKHSPILTVQTFAITICLEFKKMIFKKDFIISFFKAYLVIINF
jgi:hypothetical protein